MSLLISDDNMSLRIIKADYLENKIINNEQVQQLYGDVILQRNDIYLYTKKANYYKNIREFHLEGDVMMIQGFDTLTCNKIIHYDYNNPFLKSLGNVYFKKDDNQITCDSLYYWTELDSLSAIGDVRMVQPKEELNTSYFNYWKTNGYRGFSFVAKNNCTIKDSIRSIAANKIQYEDYTELMILNDNCKVNETNRGLSGDIIHIQYADSLIQSLSIFGNASAYNDLQALIDQNDIRKHTFRDVMSSNKLNSFFNDGIINELHLINMASTLYHVVEDSILQGVNDASGDTIKINIENNNLHRIQVIGDGRGKFFPEKNNSDVDSLVIYNAEYIDYHIDDKKTYLYTDAKVNYQGTELNSNYITADWINNLLELSSIDDILPVVDTPDGEPLSGKYMEFDLISKHGRVVKGKTNFNDGIYYGNEIYRDDPNLFHVLHSKYTSCDAKIPHFYLASNKMKMISNDRVIARPLWLFIYDIPIIGLPLAVFPNKGGARHSGWIMPSFGHRNRDGTFFQGLGYYWAPNDYLDYRILMNFYDQKGIKVNGILNYLKRYQYNGSITSNMNRNVMSKNISDIIDGNLNQSWDLRWKHNWKIDPSQNMNINWTYMSNNAYYQDSSFAHTQESRLKQRLESSTIV